MQYKTPHKIDLEDKVVGPLTMRQFSYLFAGGLIDYMLFQLVAVHYGNTLFFLLAALPTLLALALAFLKVQDQPFGTMVVAFLLYTLRGQRFVWAHLSDPHFIGQKKKSEVPQIAEKHVKKSDLDRLAALLDQRGWSADEVNQPAASPGGVNLSGRVISTTEAKPNISTDSQPPTPAA